MERRISDDPYPTPRIFRPGEADRREVLCEGLSEFHLDNDHPVSASIVVDPSLGAIPKQRLSKSSSSQLKSQPKCEQQRHLHDTVQAPLTHQVRIMSQC